MKKNQIFKKTISFITATALAFSLVTDIPFWGVEMSITANAAAAKLTDSKTGTSLQDLDGDNYYEISNANELIAFSNLVNTTRRHEYGYMESPYDSINGELTADITMPAGTVWSPIGYYNTYDDYAQYVGMFDGQCHTISGLYVNDSNKNNMGLFGAVTGSAEIKNIGVINSTFIGKFNIGSICGQISDGVRIKNCYSTGTVSGQQNVGTIVGTSNNDISISRINCYGLNEGYTEEDFSGGKIAYLLNEGKDANEPTWYQNIGSDSSPRYTGATVYCFDGEYGNHQHTFTYMASGNTLTASCSVSGCHKSGKTICISTQGKSYDGNTVTTNVANQLDSTNYDSAIVYKDNAGNILSGAPSVPGTYTANLTIGGKTVQTTFEIIKVEPVLSITAPETTAACNEVDITANAKNPNNSGLNDLPEISFTYKIGENGVETPFSSSLVVPSDVEIGTTITITAKTAENDKYVSATKKHTVTVIACQHENASTEWSKDENGHWYECTCGGKVNYGEHQSSGAPTIDTPEICTVCDYVINTETGVGAFVVEGGRRGKDYTYENNTLKIKTDKPLTIRNKDPYTPTSDMIDVMGDTDANIIFAGVNIEASFGEYPLCLYDYGDYKKVKITLAEGTKNYFKGNYKGGIGKDSYTNSLEITGTGFLYASGTSAGIGIGSDGNSTSDITINGGCVTATSIRGYTTSNIFITGGSVKAAIGCVPKDENNNDLYLMEIDNPKGEDIIINHKDYPDQHGDENKIYVYLPAKTAENPNVVKVGDVIVKYYYDVTNSEWIRVIEAPKNDETLFIYDGVEKTYFIPESDFYTIEGNKQTNAGTYAVTLSLGDGLGWSDGSTEDKQYTFEIKPKAICVKADDASKKYGEEEPVFSYTISGNSLVDGDILTGELVRDKGEVVGTYDITQGTLTNQNNPNYDITFEKGVFEIIPADICQATVVQSGKLTYNGEAQTPLFDVTLDGTILTDEDYDVIAAAQINAGEYSAKIVGKGNYTGTIFDVKWFIDKTDLTIIAESYNVKYGKVLPTLKYDVVGLQGTDAIEGIGVNVVIGYENDAIPKEVGTYPIVVNGTEETENYKVKYTNGVLSILEWESVIGVPEDDKTSFTYNGAEQIYSIPESKYYTIGGNKQTNAGKYIVTVSLVEDVEWRDGSTEDKYYTFEIKPKTIGVKASDVSKIYGDEELGLTYTVEEDGLVDDDILIGELVRDKGEAVGTYDITQGTLTNQNNPNYDITFEKGVFEITPADISQATVVQSGKLTYNGEAQTPLFDVTLGGAILTDEDYDVIAAEQINAGEYTAKIVGKGNYTGTISDIVWSMEKAELSINADSYSVKQGEVLPTLEYTVVGLQGNDTIESIGANVVIGYENSAIPKEVGTYCIVVTGAEETDNYKVIYTDGVLDILEWGDVVDIPEEDKTSFIYNGAEQTYSISQSSYYTIVGNKQTNAGKYTVIVSLVDGMKWSDDTTEDKCYTFEIAPADISRATVVQSGKLTYNGEAQTPLFDVTLGDTILTDEDYDVTVTEQTNAGAYNAKIVGKGNYAGTISDVVWSMEKAELSINADSYSVKQGEVLPTLEYTVVGLQGNDTIENIGANVLIGYENGATPKEAGTYNIVVRVAEELANYDVSFTNGVLTITEKDTLTITVSDMTLTYGEIGTKLTVITDGDGVVTYSVQEGQDVIEVAEDGTITTLMAGEAIIIVSVSETDAYKGTSCDVCITVEKATSIANTPETDLKLDSSISALEKIDLPDGWMIEETDLEKELEYNKPVQIKVVYTGEDADSYVDSALTKTITVTRICTHFTTEIRNAEKATCNQVGYSGDLYCKTCDTKLKAGTKVNKLAKHTWDDGVITKEATSAEKGKITYTCSVCNETKTEEIPPLGATTVGTKLMDDDENAWYKITDSDLKNGTVTYVSPVNKKAAKVAIPDTVEIDSVTYKVTAIGKNAFKNNSKIKNITIGKYVAVIEQKAFINCKKLKSVKLGKNVTTIGSKAFYKCVALTKFTIPSKTAKIGKQAFYGCSKLKTLTIRSSKLKTAKIGSKAFSKTPKKMTVKVPKKKMNVYKTMLCKRGINKKAKFRQN